MTSSPSQNPVVSTAAPRPAPSLPHPGLSAPLVAWRPTQRPAACLLCVKRSRAEPVGDLGSGGELVFRGVFGLQIGLGCLDGGICGWVKVEVGCGVEVRFGRGGRGGLCLMRRARLYFSRAGLSVSPSIYSLRIVKLRTKALNGKRREKGKSQRRDEKVKALPSSNQSSARVVD